MGDNGDKVPYFWILQFRGEDSQPEIVALSETKIEVRQELFVYFLSSIFKNTKNQIKVNNKTRHDL